MAPSNLTLITAFLVLCVIIAPYVWLNFSGSKDRSTAGVK